MCFKLNKDLEELNLSNNKIASLGKCAFYGLESLKTLNIENNPITSIQDEAFLSVGLLAELDLSNFQFQVLKSKALQGLTSIKKLRLFNCQLTELEDFSLSWCSKLQEVYLEGNQIASLRGAIFSNSDDQISPITNLIANKAGIQSIEPYTFKNCKFMNILQIKENNIPKIYKHTFTGMDNLMTLNINMNQTEIIETDAFKNFSCRRLYINRNSLVSIPPCMFENIQHVVKFSFSRNPDLVINFDMFKTCHDMKDLAIFGLKVENFSMNTLKIMSKLQILKVGKELDSDELKEYCAEHKIKYTVE